MLTTKVPLFSKDGTVKGIAGASKIHSDKHYIRGIIGLSRDISPLKALELEREKLIAELKHALDNIKTLHGLIPICCRCKKIRDDSGYWQQLEIYLKAHSDADFTHIYCPECTVKTLEEIRQNTSKK